MNLERKSVNNRVSLFLTAVVGALYLSKLCAELEALGNSGDAASIHPLLRRFEEECARVQSALECLIRALPGAQPSPEPGEVRDGREHGIVPLGIPWAIQRQVAPSRERPLRALRRRPVERPHGEVVGHQNAAKPGLPANHVMNDSR